MNSEEQRQTGLTRERLVTSALQLINEAGLEGLSMRALADRLEVKASSLYWHIRDRRELIELLAEAILNGVHHRVQGGDWRASVLREGASLRAHVARQKDAGRILLEAPDALARSELTARLVEHLKTAGLQPKEASDVALMIMVQVVSATEPRDDTAPRDGGVASIAVDSGSRGVALRSGGALDALVRSGRDRTTAAPAVVRGETVVVRRLRGVGVGRIEIDARRPWRFQVQGPTWNTLLDLEGIDVREVKLDSGAAKVECFLPQPRGVVPIGISGGVINVKLHRPAGVVVVADISSGAVRVKLDEFSIKAAISDLQWESEPGSRPSDRYELRISGGAVNVTMDSSPSDARTVDHSIEPDPVSEVAAVSAIEILLDGVEARVRGRRASEPG